MKNPFRDFKRRWHWFWQRRTLGFDGRELWNLNTTIANFVLPRLRAFRKCPGGYPSNLRKEGEPVNIGVLRWDAILADMIFGFEYCINDDKWFTMPEKDFKRVKRGLRYFGMYFLDLWN